MKTWLFLLFFPLMAYSNQYHIDDKGVDYYTESSRDFFKQSVAAYKKLKRESKEEQPIFLTSLQKVEPTADEICVECDRALGLSSSVVGILEAMDKSEDRGDLVANELQELEALIALVDVSNRNTELRQINCNENGELKFVEVKESIYDEMLQSTLLASHTFPFDQFDGLAMRNKYSKVMMLRGTGEDRDTFVLVSIDRENKKVTIKHLKVSNKPAINIDDLPELGAPSRSGAVGLSKVIRDSKTGRPLLEIGPVIQYKDRIVPEGIQLMSVDYASPGESVKIKGSVTDRVQELDLTVSSDTLDTVATAQFDKKKQKIRVETPFESIDAKATLTYDQDKVGMLYFDKKISDSYLLQTVVTNKNDLTSAGIDLKRDDKLLIGVQGDQKGNVAVAVPTTFDIFMTDYTVDGMTRISTSTLAGSYALKKNDEELYRYSVEKSRTSDYSKHSLSKNHNLDNGGTLSLKFTDVDGAPENSNIINESTVWLNFVQRF